MASAPLETVNRVAWARQVAVSTGLPEDLAREALDRALAGLEADPREGLRQRARRTRRLLTQAVGEARRLQAGRVDDAMRLPERHDPRLSEAAGRELYDAIAAEVPEAAQGVVRVVRIVRAPGSSSQGAARRCVVSGTTGDAAKSQTPPKPRRQIVRPSARWQCLQPLWVGHGIAPWNHARRRSMPSTARHRSTGRTDAGGYV